MGKTMKKLFIAVFLICKVSFASIDDSAVQLAAELFSRQQVADKIREMYVAAFPIAERREVLAKAVDA